MVDRISWIVSNEYSILYILVLTTERDPRKIQFFLQSTKIGMHEFKLIHSIKNYYPRSFLKEKNMRNKFYILHGLNSMYVVLFCIYKICQSAACDKLYIMCTVRTKKKYVHPSPFILHKICNKY